MYRNENNTQLVLYDPAHEVKALVVRNKPAQNNAIVVHREAARSPPRREIPRSHLGLDLKIREGDIRLSYKVLPILVGNGSFGAVRFCIHRNSKTKLAVKSITLTADNSTLVANEVGLLQYISHRNVVRVIDVVTDRKYIHIVMEQCRGKDLFDVITDDRYRPSEGWSRNIVASILDVVEYLHARHIVHRDLKAEHIVFQTGDVTSPIKIIDFGVATIHRPSDAPMTAFVGSARSVAPEIIKGRFGRECDLWSIGVLVYFLLTQELPFEGSSNEEVFQRIVSGVFYFPQWAATGLTESAKHFIDHLLMVDPWRRMTAKEALSHSWIRGNHMRQIVVSGRTRR